MHTFSSYNFTRKKNTDYCFNWESTYLVCWTRVFLLPACSISWKHKKEDSQVSYKNDKYFVLSNNYLLLQQQQIILVWAAKLQFSQSPGCNYGTPNTWLKLGDHVQQICNRESCFSYLLFIAAAILHRFDQKFNIFFQHIHRNIDIDDIYRYIIS